MRNITTTNRVYFLDNNEEYAYSLADMIKQHAVDIQVFTSSKRLFEQLKQNFDAYDAYATYENLMYAERPALNAAMAAYEQLKNRPPMMILLDFNLGQSSSQNGIGLSQAIKNVYAQCYTVLLTSYASYRLGCNAQNDGQINGFITKDQDQVTERESNAVMPSLVDKIKLHLGRAKQQTQDLQVLSGLEVKPEVSSALQPVLEQLHVTHSIIDYLPIDKHGSILANTPSGFLVLLLMQKQDHMAYVEAFGLATDEMPLFIEVNNNTDFEVLPIAGDITIQTVGYVYAIYTTRKK